MFKWRATIHVWPHSSGRGADIDQKEAGERVQTVEVSADRIDAALAMVNLYRRGIETNPMVWQAVIYGLEVTRDL